MQSHPQDIWVELATNARVHSTTRKFSKFLDFGWELSHHVCTHISSRLIYLGPRAPHPLNICCSLLVLCVHTSSRHIQMAVIIEIAAEYASVSVGGCRIVHVPPHRGFTVQRRSTCDKRCLPNARSLFLCEGLTPEHTHASSLSRGKWKKRDVFFRPRRCSVFGTRTI